MENAITSKDMSYSSNYLSSMVVVAIFVNMIPVSSVNPVVDLLPITIFSSVNATTDVRYHIGDEITKSQNEYHPKTALGKRLMALRRAYIANGGVLLDDGELEVENDTLRGGLYG